MTLRIKRCIHKWKVVPFFCLTVYLQRRVHWPITGCGIQYAVTTPSHGWCANRLCWNDHKRGTNRQAVAVSAYRFRSVMLSWGRVSPENDRVITTRLTPVTPGRSSDISRCVIFFWFCRAQVSRFAHVDSVTVSALTPKANLSSSSSFVTPKGSTVIRPRENEHETKLLQQLIMRQNDCLHGRVTWKLLHLKPF